MAGRFPPTPVTVFLRVPSAGQNVGATMLLSF